MFQVTSQISIPDEEITFQAIRAQGAGGQNVNKVASAIHLRFDVRASSLPDEVKTRLLATSDQRINSDGVVVIKAQRHRTQEKNRMDALERLRELLAAASRQQKTRKATRPTRASQQRRMDSKTKRGQIKRNRRSTDD